MPAVRPNVSPDYSESRSPSDVCGTMLRAGHAVVIAVIALLMMGMVMVTSAGLTIDAEQAVSLRGMLTSRTMSYAIIAVAMLWVGMRIDVTGLDGRRRGGWESGPSGTGLWPVHRRDACATALADGGWGSEPGGQRSEIRDLPCHPVTPSPRHPVIAPSAIRHPLSAILHPATWIFIASIVLLLLVYVDGIGREVNGARRWINLGPASWRLSFQPSEVAKWGMVIVLACYAVHLGVERMSRFWTGLLPALMMLLPVCVLIGREDLGTAVLIAAVGVLLLLAAGAKVWHLAIFAPVGAALGSFAVAIAPYRLARLETFLNPYVDPQGRGYHMIQSMIAVAEGKITGRGLGHGVYKFGYLPEDTTDFLFAVICEELGVFGAAIVIFLYATIILAGLKIIARQESPLLRLIGLGVVLTVGLQALINLTVVTGLAPTKGIALPLLSSGGTGWILTALCLGMLVGMDRRALADVGEEEATADEHERALPVVSIGAPAGLAHSPLPGIVVLVGESAVSPKAGGRVGS